jgi:hypothetical protein
MRRTSVLLGPALLVLLVFAAGAVKWYRPWLTQPRTVVTSSPSLDGISYRAEVKLPAGQSACIRPLPLDPGVRQIRMLLDVTGARAPVVELTLRGAGYEGRARFADYPVSPATIVLAQLSRAPSRAEDGELCLRNTGRRAIGLVGTSEPDSVTVPVTYVAGKSAGETDPAITFLTGEQRSVLARSGTVLDRAAAFTDVVPGWLMWPLALLFLAGLPLGVAAALLLSDRRC